MSRYPEHDKLAAVEEASQAIGEFLDFGLADQGLVLAERMQEEHWVHGPRLVGTSKSIQNILAAYFEIDQNRLEQEKRVMLDGLREDPRAT